MARWDSIKASRCQSEAYNNDKDKAPVVSKRKKRSRQLQETLEASSCTVLAAIKEKAAEEEREEGVGDGKSLATTPAPVPFKMKQSRLAAHKEDAHKEEVKSARRLKTAKEKKSKEDQPTSQVWAEARWMDTAERQGGHLNQVGKVVSLVTGRKGKTGSP